MQYTQRMQSSIKKHYFCNASIEFINNKFHFNIKKKTFGKSHDKNKQIISSDNHSFIIFIGSFDNCYAQRA